MNRSIRLFLVAVVLGLSIYVLQSGRAPASFKTPRVLHTDSPESYDDFHQSIRTKTGASAPDYEPGYQLRELRKLQRAAKNGQAALPWIERGPTNVSGRSRSVLSDPRDPAGDTWYLAAVAGGIWKTEDAGQSWRELTRDLPEMAFSALAQSASQPEVIYAGTGEGYNNIDAVSGQSLWRSGDSGETWNQIAATVDDDRFTYVTRLIVDPANSNRVRASTKGPGRVRSYVMSTDNGGTTWTPTLALLGPIDMIAANPGRFDTQFATAQDAGIYRSYNGGRTWATSNAGLTLDDFGRTELSVSPADTSRIYLSVAGTSKSLLFASFNGGDSWGRGGEGQGDHLDWLGGQGWYDNAVLAHQTNPNQVYLGGIDLLRVTVGLPSPSAFSYTSEILTDTYRRSVEDKSGTGVHPDIHALLIAPRSGGERLFLPNDGGLAISDDGGTTFLQTGSRDQFAEANSLNGPNTAQFYGVDKMNGADRYLGGTQDNGSWISPADPDAATSWIYSVGGDGFEGVWNYEDPDKIILSSQTNVFFRSTDGFETAQFAGPGDDFGPGLGPFVSRLAGSRQDADLLFAVGASGIWRSDDFAAHWSLIEPPTNNFQFSISTPRISLASPHIVWVPLGVTNGNVEIGQSRNGGQSFRLRIMLNEVAPGRPTNIATHPFDEKTLYVLFSPRGGPKVIRSTSQGLLWEDISGVANDESTRGFPDVATYDLVVMPFDTERIWVGTEIGIVETLNGGASWNILEGFPAAPAFDLEIVNDQVVVGTHGRGIWTVTMPELDGYAPQAATLTPGLSADDGVGDLPLHIRLRSAYDSTQVLINGERLTTLAENASKADTTLIVPVLVSASLDIDIRAYSEGVFYSVAKSVTRVVPLAPAGSFSSSFDDPESFSLEGLTIESDPLFGGNILTNSHPYPDESRLRALLRVPIVLGGGPQLLEYQDVALVEPGDEGTVFGDFEFWDYVAVSASNNGGVTWNVLEVYDARFSNAWLQNLSGQGNEDLFVDHSINLHDTFSAGDTILVAFELVSDENLNYWGWAVDNLVITPGAPTASESLDLPGQIELLQNYPNPFSSLTRISYTLPQAAPVSAVVYDVVGREVRILLPSTIEPAGSYTLEWDGTGPSGARVASGLYLYRLTVGERSFTKQMVLVR
jgi:photosystem II stability/assembly factor-like uncharacterized protein